MTAITGKAGLYDVAVPQLAAPLQIPSMDHLASGQFGSTIILKKVSPKAISSFQLGAISIIPAGCSTDFLDFVSDMTLGSIHATGVPAEVKDLSVHENFSDPQKLADDHDAKYIVTQVGVINVKFTDGTSWDWNAEQKVFDQESVDAVASRCSKPLPPRPPAKSSFFMKDDLNGWKHQYTGCWFFCEP